MIRVDHVSKWFGPYQVLRSVDLTIYRGERVVVCGPSGSGKSTLLRCVNGLEPYQAGRIEVDGILVSEAEGTVREVRRRVGMVFQSFNLFPHMTALENCVLGPTLVHRLPPREAEALAMSLLERVHIPEQALKYPAQLSGGQQQRVAIARALCMRPKAMLFDEPTSALDPEMIKEVLDVIVELAGSGMTMVVVTHEMGFARRVADRIVFMDGGEILQDDPPEAFFAQPRTERARQFLGQLLSH
jgi:ABC-type polar amino acid transport system ATPase subunit